MKTNLHHYIHHHRTTIRYSILLAAMVSMLKWLQWKFLIVDDAQEIYAGAIALFFTLLGMWLGHQILTGKTKSVPIKKAHTDASAKDNSSDRICEPSLLLSAREFEVLQLMAEGKSNAQIAEHLFLSLSTVKTHASNLFSKLEVKSRTQAIAKSKRIGILP